MHAVLMSLGGYPVGCVMRSSILYRLLISVGKTQTKNELNQTLKSCRPNELKLKLNSSTLQ